MIIGINGKIGSGKDTIGSIIQYLVANKKLPKNMQYSSLEELDNGSEPFSNWKIKKFAEKLKTIASLLTGIPVKNFEDQEFKKTDLGKEWSYAYPDEYYDDGEPVMVCMSVRQLLQKLGTEAMRDGLHTNVWVNALFADYNPVARLKGADILPNWCITDMRFPNEMEAVVKRKGITIRVVRYKVGDKVYWTDPEGVSSGSYEVTEVYQDFCFINNDFSEAQVPYHEIKLIAADLHPSETGLDDAEFDYEIINDGTIEDLIEKVREILTKEKII
jgi:hypothetical protein